MYPLSLICSISSAQWPYVANGYQIDSRDRENFCYHRVMLDSNGLEPEGIGTGESDIKKLRRSNKYCPIVKMEANLWPIR